MKITVIGGTGLIGSQLVSTLRAAGHEVVSASLSSGVDLLTGSGLDEALAGADTVVNVSNSPTFDEASPEFFRTTMDNLLAAGERAGVVHQVILSIVGVDQVPQLDYYRAKTLQEDVLKQGPTPYSIVRATQFFEFMDTVLSWTADDRTVRLPSTPVQPMAAADVVAALAEVATGAPLNGTVDVAGPDVFALDELGRLTLAARQDPRTVVTDEQAGMFAVVEGDVLAGGPGARLAATSYKDWLGAGR
ncbi:NAD-dependent epimerase/dehydratase family protein [Streptomyces vinaceus]|uniref:NAD-dependent epimerase/dehydratase family protein n=1 Tax=Streptomyces vinaceus TaxID=1960 RepID=A0A5J6J4Z1_STRVI|nr:NAD(P)H-binding protein [Streptomyces vinaceus]QEV43934.1 NAD-dependent epimerase/dehydratase family protein [Streptomyces vinaceus]GHE74652.1 LysR family transcriptional regulator [Streptomyces vinaceus]